MLALADDASKELTRFDAEAGMIVAPFAAILLRTESASSSEVENVTASAKQVALAEIGASRLYGNAELVVANVHAMNAAIELSDRLDERAIIAMHDALLGASAPHFVGGWRDQQVWIGGGSISPHNAGFVPPHHERVPELMRDLVRVRTPHRHSRTGTGRHRARPVRDHPPVPRRQREDRPRAPAGPCSEPQA